MTTLTKTITENSSSTTTKSTWTITVTTGTPTLDGNNFKVDSPTVSAKYSGSNKGLASCYLIISFPSGTYTLTKEYSDSCGGSMHAWASGTTETLSAVNGVSHYSLPVSRYFSSSNPTVRQVTTTAKFNSINVSSSKNDSNLTNYNSYSASNISLGAIYTFTLDAPPTVTTGTPSYTTPLYTVLGNYSVPITSAEAYYGGYITKAILAIGQNIVEQTYSDTSISDETISVTPTIAGTYTPTLTVTDSRGQTTTTTFSQITVNQYNAPSFDFDVFRSDSNGVKDDEGAYGLVTVNVSFTDAAADITEPTVQINGTTTSNVAWYSAYNSSTGVSSAISDWSTVSSGDTIYGLINGSFSQTDSYQITVQIEDSLGGESSAISQTLSTAFYTIDFQAGGKEIAFGAPANDTLTTHQEEVGLFKCGMESQFNESVTFNDIANFDKPINITGLDTEDSVIINELSSVIDLTESAPSETIYDVPIRLFDSNGTRMGSMQMWRSSGDILGYGIQTSRYVNGAWVHNDISVRIASDGTRSYGVSSPAAFRSAIGLTTTTVSVGNPTTTTGTFVSQTCLRYGNVVFLRFTFRNPGSVTSGANVYVGTMPTSLPTPSQNVTGATYYGNHALIAFLNTSRVLTIRNASNSAVTIDGSNSGTVSLTYLVTS